MAANSMPPSEFGGKVQKNTIQPPVTPRGKKGHTPTASEKLRLVYITGQDEDSTRPPQPLRESMQGLLPLAEQEKLAPQPELFIDQMEDG